MNAIVAYIDNAEYQMGYIVFQPYLDTYKSTSEFDFLFECQSEKAYAFILYCLKYRQDSILRLLLCFLLTYGEVYVDDSHNLIYEQISLILSNNSDFLPALEFAVYNYFEHPESPFSKNELLEYARKILQTRHDRVALKVIKTLGAV